MSKDAEIRSLPVVPEKQRGSRGIDALMATKAASAFEQARDRVMADLSRLVDGTDGRFPTDRAAAIGETAGVARAYAETASEFRSLADEHRASMVVQSEPRTYGPHSEHSWYLDVVRAALPGYAGHDEAVYRLRRYDRELEVELGARSEEGRRAERAVATQRRGSDREVSLLSERRAMTSGSTSGGAFVTPIYLDAIFAIFNAYPPSFLRQSVELPDPGYGLELYVPALTSDADVAEQTIETSGIADSAPAGEFLTGVLTTQAGEVEVSQQLYDRSGTVGIDLVIHAQLGQDLFAAVDAYVLTLALTGAGTVTDNGSFSVANLWADIGTARAAMRTAAGTKLPPTHIFLQPDFYEYATSLSDPNGRPLMLPRSVGPAAGQSDVGATGERILSTPAFVDGNIAASGSDTQIVVANMAEIFTLMSTPAVRAIPETFSPDLTVVLQLYSYAGAVIRHAAAVQIVTGSAYPASPSFA